MEQCEGNLAKSNFDEFALLYVHEQLYLDKITTIFFTFFWWNYDLNHKFTILFL